MLVLPVGGKASELRRDIPAVAPPLLLVHTKDCVVERYYRPVVVVRSQNSHFLISRMQHAGSRCKGRRPVKNPRPHRFSASQSANAPKINPRRPSGGSELR
jgi:hypothetical protein